MFIPNVLFKNMLRSFSACLAGPETTKNEAFQESLIVKLIEKEHFASPLALKAYFTCQC